MKRLRRRFFERYTPEVARDLLGKRLVRVKGGLKMSGMVVETEAYRGARDPASHAYKGRTARNSVMFSGPGLAYVYFTMGLHYCLNLTTERVGSPGAVLIRALEPLEGFNPMAKMRGVAETDRLTNGPANLTRALSIDKRLNGEDVVTSRRLYLEELEDVSEAGTTSRVGITEGRTYKWRYFIKGSAFVSKGRPSLNRPRIHN